MIKFCTFTLCALHMHSAGPFSKQTSGRYVKQHMQDSPVLMFVLSKLVTTFFSILLHNQKAIEDVVSVCDGR